MTRITLENRIAAFNQLGNTLNELLTNELHSEISKKFAKRFNQEIATAFHHNGWFDENSVRSSIQNLLPWLKTEALTNWVQPYSASFNQSASKRVGVIMAGNIPLVGFHDFLAVLISGNQFVGKTSSKDPLLPKLIADLLIEIEPIFSEYVELTNGRFEQIDGVIATGSNNSMRYFEHYFGKYPHILRGNRNSIAILDGTESKQELQALGSDIFNFYGLGCRNVTNIFVPEGYNFSSFFESIEPLSSVLNNKKYANNYEYNRTVWLLNQEKNLLDNNFLIIKKDKSIGSPIGTLFYDYYSELSQIDAFIEANAKRVQCVISRNNVPFGASQQPKLTDYADNVNSLEFLSSLR